MLKFIGEMNWMPYVAIAALFLVGCDNPPEQWTGTSTGPLTNVKGLEDCSYHELHTGVSIYKIVRCPNSTTNIDYQSGKTRQNTTTLDDSKIMPELPREKSIQEIDCVNYNGQLYCKDK